MDSSTSPWIEPGEECAPVRRGRARSHWQREPDNGGEPPEPVSDEKAEEIARTIILNRLDRSSASRAQLAELCAKKLVPDHIADRVLDRFEEVGLIDDAAYAAMLVSTRHNERQLAGKALRVELAKKGITGEAAQAALEQVDADDELEAARAIVAKRMKQASMQKAPRDVQKRRLFGALGRKGHSSSVAYRVIDEALGRD
ncbi:regulatory protein RecX [Bowdeniella nasicola]|uniref:regulatory protein RecX n=1 Tax=Bowdeniella nasicola TaxID=208480 RepID=UPI0009F8BECE|nr:regulatory protein RecX [Bowdeniella nasicola]